MLSLSSIIPRTYIDETDSFKIASLINTCATVYQLDIETSVQELRKGFAAPGFDINRDLRLWCDSEQNVIGFGQLKIPTSNHSEENTVYLRFRVHPSVRNAALETQIITWGLQRMQEVGQERQTRTKLCISVRESENDRIALLQQHGFVAERVFYRMERSLLQPIPAPQFPSGFSLRHIEGDHEAEAWVEMFNQTFIDHWDFHPMTVELWHYYGTEPNYQLENDLVAVSENGTLAAFCYCEIDQEQHDRDGQNKGWINLLGTRRGFRGRGLGRAMLLAGLHRLRQLGVETVLLGVDSQNPSGALKLYQSVGFTQKNMSTRFAKS